MTISISYIVRETRMKISLIEPTARYLRINRTTRHVHLFVPFIAGQEISTDNTCKTELELRAFFEGGAVRELESWKSTLEFHCSLLDEGELRQAKTALLAEINTYLDRVIGLRTGYKEVVAGFLAKPSNLYSIQLRPRSQDPYSQVVNPVFTVNRNNDLLGNPASPLFNTMHAVFPTLTLGEADPRTQLVTRVLNALPEHASFEGIQMALAKQCKVPEDFFKRAVDERRIEHVVNQAYIDNMMGFDAETTSEEYIRALLGVCAPNLQATLQGSPFYLDIPSDSTEKAERLSMLTQFYLGRVLN